MKKLKITDVNILVFIIVILLTVLPQIIQVVLGRFWNIDIADLVRDNESVKNIVIFIDQFGFILLPIIAFCFINKVNAKRIFRLNPAGIPTMLLTVLMAGLAWIVSQSATIIFYYIYSKLFGTPAIDAIQEIIPKNVLLGFLLIVVTPAICEEALFRGLVLRAYENLGTARAIAISSILFSMIHFSAIRLIGPLFIGILSGYLVVRANSIIPGILTHLTFNGISIAAFYTMKVIPEQVTELPTIPEMMLLMLFGIFSLALLAVCIMGFNYFTKPVEQSENPKGYNKLVKLMVYNVNNPEQIRFNKAENSILHDFVSIVSHWPVVIIIVITILINTMEIISVVIK